MAAERADDFLRMIRRSQRGRLKVYLGYAAGVGKTYLMLQEAHRLQQEGVDVVVGLVETHGRAETAKLIEGLEVIPRFLQQHRGIIVEEMDVNAILRRKPQVAMVDELAHSNVPGSRNAKRYEDVQDLLAAGIHVVTTMNVQHLESLYDVVEKTVRVKVRERLPDSILAEADQIVNVDLTPEDLQERLKEGKVYPAERISTAFDNFFKTPNLENLRELTLREMAAQIDLRRHETLPEDGSIVPDQIMVCLSSRGPNSEMLLRYASRLAGKLNRNWYAVYVQTPSEDAVVIDSRTQRLLSGVLTLAKELGAMVFTYKGEDIAGTILRFAREYQVGHIVTGSPARISFWKRIIGKKSIPELLMEQARGVTIVALDTKPQEAVVAGPTSFIEEEPQQVVKTPSQIPPAQIQKITMSSLINESEIIIWDKPVDTAEVLEKLVKSACNNGLACDFSA
jgi:two-component system sensor histidine kinase KdpD